MHPADQAWIVSIAAGLITTVKVATLWLAQKILKLWPDGSQMWRKPTKDPKVNSPRSLEALQGTRVNGLQEDQMVHKKAMIQSQ